MRILYLLFIFSAIISSGCKETKKPASVPDLQSTFKRQLQQKDSTLLLDSFYLAGIDTMTMRSSLIHQRFPYLHLLSRLELEADSIQKLDVQYRDLDHQKQVEEERKYVADEIDSINHLLLSADSTNPVGYRVLYKVVVHKKDHFILSDTVSYSLSPQMEISDWDRNIEKDKDSLVLGKKVQRAGYNLK
ncbi:MAG TPA: hypothetical protein VFV08_11520 [Puia sp.]|nr:hypothetical protein [Puia sp.]